MRTVGLTLLIGSRAYDTGVEPNRHASRLIVFLFLTRAGFISCQTTASGRKQLNFYSLSQEMRLGSQAWEEALEEAAIVADGPDAEMVERIGRAIAKTARKRHPDPARKFRWEFKLLDEPETVNAWALPGGKCAVYSGLLKVTETEDGLAVVMGHEVAHALLRHGGERLSQGMVFQGAMMTADHTLEKSNPENRRTIMAALGLGATLGILLPYSRSHESEADELGLFLSAASGFDPRAAVPLWERMEKASGKGPPTFLSTHPSEQNRIRRLAEITPRALGLWRRATGAEDKKD